ncbi:MAG: 16S rRNA (cytosine(1402)-N(4))-methyltransferase RsmH [Bryobacterales bacterium]|nr:16S rRNA (cytosine(1402)-N(4))-methyltransferase RsmH [Bryobacterales bacterium]
MDWHEPVLLEEVLHWLALGPDSVVAEGTVGLGGHSRPIAEALTGSGRLIGLDRDAQSLAKARENLADLAGRITFVHARFSTLRSVLDELRIAAVNGLLIDCGVSRYQLTSPDRGFSFDSAASLDMRMNQSEDCPTAADIVNFGSEKEIARILYELGEERRGRTVARAIVRARPIRSTQSLAEVIESVVARAGRVRGSTRSLQALRIYVNSELEEVEALVGQLEKILAPGARAVFITFHSLEDRIVKRGYQAWHKAGRARVLTKHVVTPGPEEMRRNPASRSAKLRALEWIG